MIDWIEIIKLEETLGKVIHDELEMKRNEELKSSKWRKAKIGGAAIIGAGLLAVTGGLAAPFLVAATTAYLGVAITTTSVVVIFIFTIFTIFKIFLFERHCLVQLEQALQDIK